MKNVIRVALPGYDALSDTNLDHFSLYTDIDNILLKRKQTGNATIADGSPTIETVVHGLGYIPFFVTYYYDEVNSVYRILNNQWNPASVPAQICGVDTSNLKIHNYGGHGSGNVQVWHDIFYDNMNDTTAPSITESEEVLKVARPGIDALGSKNPNDYIMHSDLNNFKILGQGTKTSLSIPAGGLISPTSYAHGVNIQAPVKFFCFMKFADGKTAIIGDAGTFSYDESKGTIQCSADTTNLYFYNFGGSTITVDIAFIFYGTGKNNTVDNSGQIITVASSGKNALTETNPDNYNFHSKYSTLKYYLSDNYNMGSITTTTVATIPHNLGYVPFFVAFVNDIAANIGSGFYAIAPYYYGRSTIPSPTRDVAAFAYADSTNIYLKAYYQTNAIGTAFTFNFYYKIFKNNLGI